MPPRPHVNKKALFVFSLFEHSLALTSTARACTSCTKARGTVDTGGKQRAHVGVATQLTPRARHGNMSAI